MDQSGSVVGRDVVGQDHEVRVGDVDEVEGSRVADALELRARERLQHLDRGVREQLTDEFLGDHQ
jgi:hypothetical protein